MKKALISITINLLKEVTLNQSTHKKLEWAEVIARK